MASTSFFFLSYSSWINNALFLLVFYCWVSIRRGGLMKPFEARGKLCSLKPSVCLLSHWGNTPAFLKPRPALSLFFSFLNPIIVLYKHTIRFLRKDQPTLSPYASCASCRVCNIFSTLNDSWVSFYFWTNDNSYVCTLCTRIWWGCLVTYVE